jgi:prepilin-type N-terminal cleavage/methylation domain-containing protein
MRNRRSRQAGLTLIEVLVAITLLALLSVGMMVAMQIGLSSFAKVDRKLMDNRRVSGAQRLLEQELEGIMPVVAPCGKEGRKFSFFSGEPQVLRLVSTFSLQDAWRGQPQILELFVIPGEDGVGFRLVVNEVPYPGPFGAGQLCLGVTPDPLSGSAVPKFLPPVPSGNSFVLADKLAYCHFVFLSPPLQPNLLPFWTDTWVRGGWPQAVRIEMAPMAPDFSRLQPISVVAPIFIHRNPDVPYGDF